MTFPLFVCDDCGCIDNTAPGNYWTQSLAKRREPGLSIKCTECQGRPWHGYFPKEPWDGKNTQGVMNR